MILNTVALDYVKQQVARYDWDWLSLHHAIIVTDNYLTVT